MTNSSSEMVLMYLLVPSAFVRTGKQTILGGMGGIGRAVTAVSVVGDSVGAGSARAFRAACLPMSSRSSPDSAVQI